MGLRFLVVEGNTRGARLAHREAYGLTPSESYAEVIQAIERDAVCDIALPADEGANLPDAAGLESYDGIVLTGSHLNIYDRTPEILRQIDLMRAVYASQTPSFGSCWGLQMAAVAADGDVRPNPLGREVGIARKLTRTEAGQAHPMLEGRPAAYDAPAIHLDAVTTLPGDCTVLAGNAVSPVQAAEIRNGGGVFWGVQYHPEFSLGELADHPEPPHRRPRARGLLPHGRGCHRLCAGLRRTRQGSVPLRSRLAARHRRGNPRFPAPHPRNPQLRRAPGEDGKERARTGLR